VKHASRFWRSIRQPDNWVLAGWLGFQLAIALTRREYEGDGLRHIVPVLSAHGPVLGEPRWLLFPGLMFLLIRPFVALGWITDIEQAIHVSVSLSLVCGFGFLLLLRSALKDHGFEPGPRAVALALAGASAPLLFYSANTVEPLPAAALAVAGLVYAGRCAHRGAARRGVLVALAMIALATLLYQGVGLAVFLLPCFVPPRALRDRVAILAGALILACAPVFILVALMWSGDPAQHALARILHGEENPLYRTFLTVGSSITSPAAALLAGPPQGIVSLPDFSGVRQVIASLHSDSERAAGMEQLGLLALGWCAFGSVCVAAIRRRHWSLLIATAGLLILPMAARGQQYYYLKYYILFPAVLALGATALPSRWVALIAACVFAANGIGAAADVRTSRSRYEERAHLYRAFGPEDCWVTAEWTPALRYRWPGRVCPILGTLAGGHGGGDESALIRSTHIALHDCLRNCFCTANVLTDDLLLPARASSDKMLAHFQYPEPLPAAVFLDSSQVKPLTRTEPLVWAYPARLRSEACAALKNERPFRQ